jgi:hypothetical protein
MELIWLGIMASLYLAITAPTAAWHRLLELIMRRKHQVPSTYWGRYAEFSEHQHLDGEDLIQLPPPCRKPVTPIGGTAYGKGKAFVS